MKPAILSRYQCLIEESSMQRTLGVLATYPDREFSLSDLAKEAGVAKPNIGAILDRLDKLGMITITKLANIWQIKAKTQNLHFQKTKIVRNLHLIYQSGLIEFLNEKYRNPRSIILFGSFRTGEDLSTSDIDIAIESDEPVEYQTAHLSDLEGIEKTVHRKIQIHRFHRKRIDAHTFTSIANGIVLLGSLEAHP